MSGVSTSLRFPGQLNSDLRKLAVNMVRQLLALYQLPRNKSSDANHSVIGSHFLDSTSLWLDLRLLRAMAPDHSVPFPCPSLPNSCSIRGT